MYREEILQNSILKRLPNFELSYETISHKKVSSYDICMAIPLGKKSFLWFTFKDNYDVCYLLDLNKEKRITGLTEIKTEFDPRLALGTILYGTMVTVQERKWFIVEDILFFKGIPLKNSKTIERLAFTEKVMEATNRVHSTEDEFVIMLTSMWKFTPLNNSIHTADELSSKLPVTDLNIATQRGADSNLHRYKTDDDEIPTTIPANIACYINYPVHHIQYRSTDTIMPYLNVNINKKINIHSISKTKPLPPKNNSDDLKTNSFDAIDSFTMDFFKPQYKHPTIFQVTADIQFDIYHLFAYGKNQKPVYYNVAYVPNYKTSVFLNGLFRKIRENKNLDYIEESDDEDEFQNIEEDRYVDLKKVLLMECVFHFKFKKWIPIKVVDSRSRVVHIDNLVKYSNF